MSRARRAATRLGRLGLLAARMLRYRVALLLWTFLLLGTASHGGPGPVDLRLGWAALALAASYVAATTVNDVADRDVDLVNHPRDAGRPLVLGTATEGELYAVHAGAAVLAVTFAVPLGVRAVTVVATGLLIGHAYSLPPLRLSYRTWLAPLVLAVAYVVIPFALGLIAIAARWTRRDAILAAALFVLFLARIVLKDFRDREGDARYGKPTLLLRSGKLVTCLVSLAALVLGDVLLAAALRPPPAVAALLQVFVVAVAGRLWALWTAADERSEQLAIAVGARMGNGLLLTALGWLVLAATGAPGQDQVLFVSALTLLFAVSYVTLVGRPDEAVIGYKA